MAMNWKASFTALTLAGLATVPATAQAQGQAVELAPAAMKRVGQVDERYQSYNVEMLDVTGGRFWKPNGQAKRGASPLLPATARTHIDPSRGHLRVASAQLRQFAA